MTDAEDCLHDVQIPNIIILTKSIWYVTWIYDDIEDITTFISFLSTKSIYLYLLVCSFYVRRLCDLFSEFFIPFPVHYRLYDFERKNSSTIKRMIFFQRKCYIANIFCGTFAHGRYLIYTFIGSGFNFSTR